MAEGAGAGGFTDAAKLAISAAHEEALSLGHECVGTEHLLLGLLREEESTAARALAESGVGLEQVLLGVQQIVGVGSSRSDHLPLTSRAKRVMENAATEARSLGDDEVGTAHILLAVVQDGEGVGAQILRGMGINLREVRTNTLALLPGP